MGRKPVVKLSLHSSRLAALFSAAIAATASAQPITVTLTTSHSNTLFEDPLGATSAGASSFFYSGLTMIPSLRRGLIAFDLSGIPAGSTITGASLTLHVSRTSTGNESVSLHDVLANWGSGTSNPGDPGGFGAPATPGDATWLNTFYAPGGGGPTWAHAGGDFDPAELASTVVGGVGYYTWQSDTLTADLQRWLDHPEANFGWMVIGDEVIPQTAKRFDSGLNPDPALRPALVITYSIPAPGGVVVLSPCCLAAHRRRRP
jgi:hypothetical protein